MFDISCSLVTFHNKKKDIQNVIDSLSKFTLKWKLVISDNSHTPVFKEFESDRVEYHHNKKNLGFGAAHNKAFELLADKSKYHLIINPDIYFDAGVLEELYDFMENDKETAILAPKILFPDGSLQYSSRLLPSFFDLVLRRSAVLRRVFINRVNRNNLEDYRYDKILSVNFLLGCFLLCRTSKLREVNGFDERFFLYMEDFDLVRRMSIQGKVLLYPFTHVYHLYERGATKKIRLLLYLLHSAYKYFNKWGWIDKQRLNLNSQVIEQLR